MRYNTPASFRQALEERLRQRARETGEPLVRMRKRLVFERCMARLQKKPENPWVVKGGFALELRLGMQARMTKDLDLGVDLGYFGSPPHTSIDVVGKLREDLGESMEDGFTFHVPSRGEHALPIPGVQAYRFTVEARLDGREFESISVDIGIGDPLIPPFEELKGSDLLSFAEIPIVRIRATSRAQHLAEKVHALTRPNRRSDKTCCTDQCDLHVYLHLNVAECLAKGAGVRMQVSVMNAVRRSI